MEVRRHVALHKAATMIHVCRSILGLGFAAFSGAIDTYIRWESPDEDA